MQTQKLKPFFSIICHNNVFIRSVAVASTAVKSAVTTNLKPWTEIPGPSSLPIIGILHHFLPGGSLQNISDPDASKEMFHTYGPMVRLDGFLGLPPIIMLADPDLCEIVLRGENSMPRRPGFPSLEYYRKYYKKEKAHNFKTTGLVTDQGEPWKDFRSSVNPVMLQPKTIKLYAKVLEEVADDMITRMKSIRDENNMIKNNFDVEMNLWALESIATVALGLRLNCFDPKLAEDSPERQMIKCIHDLFSISEKLDFKPSLWRYIPTPQYKKAMKLYERHENLTKYFIKKGMKELEKNNNDSNEKGVLAKLLEIDEEYAFIMASDMLFAGVDTAANTMTAALYLLASNPDKQDKLRAEILSKSERKPYLKACIKETLRMMPVVTGNFRQTTKEYNLLDYKIPKDMYVVLSHREMSKMESQFVRPSEFLPERWIATKDDPLYYRNAHPFAHAPFGFGVRSCIGRRIAELEMETFLSKVIESFRWEWIGPPPKVVQMALSYVRPPFNFIIKDI